MMVLVLFDVVLFLHFSYVCKAEKLLYNCYKRSGLGMFGTRWVGS
jgi:hypothetical protein